MKKIFYGGVEDTTEADKIKTEIKLQKKNAKEKLEMLIQEGYTWEYIKINTHFSLTFLKLVGSEKYNLKVRHENIVQLNADLDILVKKIER